MRIHSQRLSTPGSCQWREHGSSGFRSKRATRAGSCEPVRYPLERRRKTHLSSLGGPTLQSVRNNLPNAASGRLKSLIARGGAQAGVSCVAALLWLVPVSPLTLSVSSASHVTRIGGEAVIALPASASWNSVVNVRPGDGETVVLNPPRFSWTYAPDPANSDNASTAYGDIAPKEFIFQLADNAEFQSPVVDVRTPWNMYNLLPALTEGTQYFWRVGYIEPVSQDRSTWTLAPASWSSGASAWITNRFTIATNAVAWDRSMLADEGYLADKAQHPHILFTSANRRNIMSWLDLCATKSASNTGTTEERAVGRGWDNARAVSSQVITSTWYPNAVQPGWVGNWAYSVGTVAFVAALTQDPQYDPTGIAAALDLMATYLRENNGACVDGVGGNALLWCYRTVAFGYDWFYSTLTPEQRENCLKAIELRAAASLYAGNWWETGAWGGYCDSVNGDYPGPFTVRMFNAGKTLNNHQVANFYYSLWGALAAYNESAVCRRLFDAGINYMLGATFPHGGFEGGLGQGRSYLYTMLFNDGGMEAIFQTCVWYAITFPEAHFNRNPFWSLNADWFSRMWPVGYTQGHEGWGDVGWGGSANPWLGAYGTQLASFAGSPTAYQHSKSQRELVPAGSSSERVWTLPFSYYYPPPQLATNSEAAVFPEGGWAFSCSLPPNLPSAYSDGIGIVLQARPGGCQPLSHSHFSDLSFDLWAYGSTLTDAGSGMTYYGKDASSHYSLLVNGYGTMQPMEAPSEPYYSRLIAFRDTADYTYMAADATLAYPHGKFYPAGWLVSAGSYSNLSYVTKIQRHVLFQRKKYFIVCDLMEATEPCTLSWMYHVLEDTVANVDANNISFEYTSNIRRLLGVDANAEDVRVCLKHIYKPADLDLVHLSGNDVARNPITGADFWSSSDTTHPRAHAFWVSNRTPSTKWMFLSVIYPVKKGQPVPTITRLDDLTVRVASGDEDDVISFDPATPQPATVVVDLATISAAVPIQRPAAPSGLHVLP